MFDIYKKALDDLHATDALKTKLKSAVQQEYSRAKKAAPTPKKISLYKWRIIALQAAVAAALLFIFLAGSLYFNLSQPAYNAPPVSSSDENSSTPSESHSQSQISNSEQGDPTVISHDQSQTTSKPQSTSSKPDQPSQSSTQNKTPAPGLIDMRQIIILDCHDDWIFYRNNADSGKLYKMHLDGTGKTKVIDDIITHRYPSKYSMLIIDGGWIYYQNASDGNKLYKIRTDGTGRTKLIDEPGALIHLISDDWIYYYFDSPDEDGFYKIKTDGTQKTKLSYQNYDFVYVLARDKGWLYCRGVRYAKSGKNPTNDPEGDKSTFFRMKDDGTEIQVLYDNHISLCGIAGDWIYFIGKYRTSNSYDTGLFIMRTDGTNEAVWVDHPRYLELLFADGWIYYTKSSEKGIFKVRPDGTQITKITSDNIMGLYNSVILDGWIYYNYNPEQGTKFAKICTDGTQKTDLSNVYAEKLLTVKDGWIYYRGSSLNEIAEDNHDIIIRKDRIYKVRTDGTENQEIIY